MFSLRPPEIVKVTVNKLGVRMGNQFVPLSTIRSFHIRLDEEEPHLIFKLNHVLSPYFIVPIEPEKVDTEDLRDFLLGYLDEEDLKEPFIYEIFHKLGL